MKNSMVIKKGNGEKTFYICESCEIREFDPNANVIYNKKIDIYLSFKHAEENGWRFTRDIKHCPPSNEKGVFICPECARGRGQG